VGIYILQRLWNKGLFSLVLKLTSFYCTGTHARASIELNRILCRMDLAASREETDG